MPPRKVASKPSSRQQTILFFKTPSKITKSQALHHGTKKDVSTSKKRAAVSPPAADAASLPTQKATQTKPKTQPQTEEERTAASLDTKAIREYYTTSILGPRRVPPVHQDDLTLEEKVLRHFDMSSQYGPCIGMSRIDRWKRAKGMGMNPPVEVLCVCLKTERELGGAWGKDKEFGSVDLNGVGVDKRRDTRRAYLDDALSTRTAREHEADYG